MNESENMLEQVIAVFYQQRNPELAKGMAAYMKDQFPFLGVKKPERALLSRRLLMQAKKAAGIDWRGINRLWDLPEREFQYLAVDCLLASAKKLQAADIARIEGLIVNKSWWDTVDQLATITGVLVLRYPELIHSHILRWSCAADIWLRRVAILFQLKYKDKTDQALLSRIILENNQTKEFFLNKAIGWALREYSKTNKQWVRDFIASHNLHPLSIREGSKYI